MSTVGSRDLARHHPNMPSVLTSVLPVQFGIHSDGFSMEYRHGNPSPRVLMPTSMQLIVNFLWPLMCNLHTLLRMWSYGNQVSDCRKTSAPDLCRKPSMVELRKSVNQEPLMPMDQTLVLNCHRCHPTVTSAHATTDDDKKLLSVN